MNFKKKKLLLLLHLEWRNEASAEALDIYPMTVVCFYFQSRSLLWVRWACRTRPNTRMWSSDARWPATQHPPLYGSSMGIRYMETVSIIINQAFYLLRCWGSYTPPGWPCPVFSVYFRTPHPGSLLPTFADDTCLTDHDPITNCQIPLDHPSSVKNRRERRHIRLLKCSAHLHTSSSSLFPLLSRFVTLGYT